MYLGKEYLHPDFHNGSEIYGCVTQQVHCVCKTRGAAVLTPSRPVNKNISLCFSICILLQAEQKPAAIRHTKPEMKSPLPSVATCSSRVGRVVCR